MSLLGKIYSFRARIALVLILTLVVTTAALYVLNQRAERGVIEEVDQQRRDLAEAIDIAQQSLSSKQWLRDLEAYLKNQRSRRTHESHVQRILVVDSQDKVYDSSYGDDIDKRFEELGFGTLEQTGDLEGERVQRDKSASTGQYQIYKFPVRTTGDEVYYLVIIFSSRDLPEQLQESSRNRLLVTGGVLLISILSSLLLILEFTRPVGKLVEAAKRVAAGDFDVCLPAKRRDELGHLMAVFNEMVEGLRERHELEARLYRAEQSAIVGRLASGIAHEVKNPLNYISLTIDYLRSKYAPAAEDARERFFEKMDSIKDEIKRLDHLIRNFLIYGRPLNLSLKPVALRELISSILALASEQAEQQSVEILLDKETNIPVIEADAERLKSCFSNLVLNAQQAMPNGGQLHVNFSSKNDGVEVKVADTGGGIAPENIGKIFEPYFSTKETGTGLGLALVKRIVEGHGGLVRVESTLGRGTTFYIWLPSHPPKLIDQATESFQIDRLESLPV